MNKKLRDRIENDYLHGTPVAVLARKYRVGRACIVAALNPAWARSQIVGFKRLNEPPVTLTRHGLPYVVRAANTLPLRRFLNGWTLCDVSVINDDYIRGDGWLVMDGSRCVCSGKSIRVAQWRAGIYYIREYLSAAPEQDTYLRDLEDQVGELTTLGVWADRLDDLESPFGLKLRAILPKPLREAKHDLETVGSQDPPDAQ